MKASAVRPAGRSPVQPPSRRRNPLTSVLQARVTSDEHDLLERLAHQHGITLSEAIRLGAWSYLLARGAEGPGAAAQ